MRPHANRRTAALAILAAVFALYVLTLAPTFSWGDSADLPLRIFGEPAAEARFTARDYVFYRLVGRLFLLVPIGDVAYRINLMSAAFGTAGVLATYFIVTRRTGRVAAGVVGALALACSHTWWWMSVVSEIYTFAGSLLLISLWLWLEWGERRSSPWLIGASFASGLSASAHGGAALVLIPVVWHLFRCRRQLTMGQALAAGAAIVGGSGFLVKMVVDALLRGGVTGLSEAIDASNPNVPLMWSPLFKASALMLYQYPILSTVLGAVGFARAWRERLPWDRLLIGTWGILVLWAILSRIPDLFNAYCLSFALLAPFVGIGAAEAIRVLEQRWAAPTMVAALAVAVVCIPVSAYAATPAIADYLHVDVTGARRCPERNNNWYFLFPPKAGDYGARHFAEAALDAAGPRGVIVADYTLWRPLGFLQLVEQRRPDVTLQIVDPLLGGDSLPQFVRDTMASRPVYLAAIDPPGYYDVPRLRKSFSFKPVGPIVQLLPY